MFSNNHIDSIEMITTNIVRNFSGEKRLIRARIEDRFIKARVNEIIEKLFTASDKQLARKQSI